MREPALAKVEVFLNPMPVIRGDITGCYQATGCDCDIRKNKTFVVHREVAMDLVGEDAETVIEDKDEQED